MAKRGKRREAAHVKPVPPWLSEWEKEGILRAWDVARRYLAVALFENGFSLRSCDRCSGVDFQLGEFHEDGSQLLTTCTGCDRKLTWSLTRRLDQADPRLAGFSFRETYRGCHEIVQVMKLQGRAADKTSGNGVEARAIRVRRYKIVVNAAAISSWMDPGRLTCPGLSAEQQSAIDRPLSDDKILSPAEGPIRRISATPVEVGPTGSPKEPTSRREKGLRLEVSAQRLFKAMGYRVRSTAATGDGGVDLVLVDGNPVSGGTYVVQCKNYRANIGQPAIRDFYGTVMHEKAQKGIFITTSKYTKAARKFAEGKPIKLIDGKELDLLMWRFLPDAEQDERRVELHENRATQFYEADVSRAPQREPRD